MPRTKVVNQTGSSIILKEGTAGVYRMLCANLQTGKEYNIKVDTNATYREYWCAVTSDDDKHVVLSSDDCMEYREVRIRLKADKTYTWDAVKRKTHEFVKDAGDKEAAKQQQAQALTEGVVSPGEDGVAGKAWNRVKGWFSREAN